MVCYIQPCGWASNVWWTVRKWGWGSPTQSSVGALCPNRKTGPLSSCSRFPQMPAPDSQSVCACALYSLLPHWLFPKNAFASQPFLATHIHTLLELFILAGTHKENTPGQWEMLLFSEFLLEFKEPVAFPSRSYFIPCFEKPWKVNQILGQRELKTREWWGASLWTRQLGCC